MLLNTIWQLLTVIKLYMTTVNLLKFYEILFENFIIHFYCFEQTDENILI